ncbi:uncharacterized protein [Ptychodera flava]|uniref:uncharacterized protein n=1 Tax=Ptychodera flava TaxID=63121 RepID=UPI00396AAA8F
MDKLRWTVLLALLPFLIAVKIASSMAEVVILVGCLVTDNETTIDCRNFTLVSYRAVVEPTSQASSVLISSIWIVVSLQVDQSFPSFQDTIRIVVRKLYFYKDGFLLLWMIMYYYIMFFSDPGQPGPIDYLVLPIELTTSSLLMYILNYRTAPSNKDQHDHPRVLAIYKTVLMTFALYNLYRALVGNIYIGIEIYTVTARKLFNRLKAKHSLNLLSLVIAAAYRYILGNFYLKKLVCCLKEREYVILRDEDDDLSLLYNTYPDLEEMIYHVQ